MDRTKSISRGFSLLAVVGLWFGGAAAQTPQAPQPKMPPINSTTALKNLAKAQGADPLLRIVLVEGRYGEHQPRAWRIQSLDRDTPGRIRETMVSARGVDSNRVVLAFKQNRIVPINQVAVNSQKAFLKAELAAKDAKVGFDGLDYQLIMPADSQEPVWIVSLKRAGGVRVGEVQIGAKSGSVLRKAWPSPKAAPAPPRPKTPAVAQAPKPKPKLKRTAQTAARPAPERNRPPRTPRVKATSQRPPARPAKPAPAIADAASVKEASGQILESARQGILKTGGTVRDFLKDALREKE